MINSQEKQYIVERKHIRIEGFQRDNHEIFIKCTQLQKTKYF